MRDNTRLEETARVTAHGSDGRTYTVLEHTDFHVAGDTKMPGRRLYFALTQDTDPPDNIDLTRLEKGRYQRADSEVILVSDDPAAP